MKVGWGNTSEGDKLNLNNLVETSKSRVEENTAGGRVGPSPLTANNDGTDTQEGGTDILVSKEAAVIPNVGNIVDSVDEKYENWTKNVKISVKMKLSVIISVRTRMGLR